MRPWIGGPSREFDTVYAAQYGMPISAVFGESLATAKNDDVEGIVH